MNYYHHTRVGPSAHALREALKYCAGLALRAGAKQILVAVHTKNHLDADMIQDAFGKPLVDTLQKKNVATLPSVDIHLMTEKITPRGFHTGPAIAPHVSPKYLAKIIDYPGVTDVVYVPWTKAELEHYLQQYHSVPLGDDTA
jgi:hypothetical protein